MVSDFTASLSLPQGATQNPLQLLGERLDEVLSHFYQKIYYYLCHIADRIFYVSFLLNSFVFWVRGFTVSFHKLGRNRYFTLWLACVTSESLISQNMVQHITNMGIDYARCLTSRRRLFDEIRWDIAVMRIYFS